LKIISNPKYENEYDATENKLKKISQKCSIKFQNSEIVAQIKNYAKLTKGDTVHVLEQGYWMISNKRSGGFAWCRIKSDG